MSAEPTHAFGVPYSEVLAQLERVQVALERLRSYERQVPLFGGGGPDADLRSHEMALKRARFHAGLSHEAYVFRYAVLFGAILAGLLTAFWAGHSPVIYWPRQWLSAMGPIGRVLVLAVVAGGVGYWRAESQWRTHTASVRAALKYDQV